MIVDTRFVIWVASLTLLICGCAAKPQVHYEKGLTEDSSGKIKFYLGRSNIVLGKEPPPDNPGKDEKPAALDLTVGKMSFGELKKALKATVVPETNTNEIYALIPDEPFGVEYNLAMSYPEDGMRLKALTTDTQDNRATIFSSIANVLASAFVFAGGALAVPADDFSVPVVIETGPDTDVANAIWRDLPKNPGWCYQLFWLSKSAEGAPLKADAFFSKHANKAQKTNAFPVVACRKASLAVVYRPKNAGNGTSSCETDKEKVAAKGKDATMLFPSLTMADPDMVVTYSIPRKGAVTAHAVCGADTSNSATKFDTSWDILSGMVDKVSAIKKAQSDK